MDGRTPEIGVPISAQKRLGHRNQFRCQSLLGQVANLAVQLHHPLRFPRRTHLMLSRRRRCCFHLPLVVQGSTFCHFSIFRLGMNEGVYLFNNSCCLNLLYYDSAVYQFCQANPGKIGANVRRLPLKKQKLRGHK
jgi:hypothetical protein